MDKAAFDRMYADPEFQALPLADKQEVLKAARAGTYTYVGERPPPQDTGAESIAPIDPRTVAPQPGVTPAAGVLNAPTNVRTDEQGRVESSQFMDQAARDVATAYPGRERGAPLGQQAGDVISRYTHPAVGAVAQAGIESALPVSAGIVGGAAGTLLGGVGAVPGAMAGSGLGEIINQALNITPESKLQVGLAAAGPLVPVVGKGVKVGAEGFKRTVQAIPGVWERGREKALEAVSKTATPVLKSAVDTAYDLARQAATSAPAVTLAKTRDALTQYFLGQAPGGPITSKQKIVSKLMQQVQNNLFAPRRDPVTGAMLANNSTFKDVVNQFDRVGRTAFKDMGRKGLDQAAHLWGAMVDDIERAAEAGHIGAETARKAAEVFKHRLGILKIDQAIEKAKTYAPGKWAGDRLDRALNETKDLLPPPVHAALTEIIGAFKARPDRPLGQMSALFSGAVGFGTGNPVAALAMLAPRMVWDGLKHAKPLNPTTSKLLTAAYQGARRLVLTQRRQDLHRGGDPDSDYGLQPNEEDMADAADAP
jgi:hypothetical protein